MNSELLEIDCHEVTVGKLNDELQLIYPEMSQQTYKITVNGEFATFSEKLEDGDKIVLLPSIMGG